MLAGLAVTCMSPVVSHPEPCKHVRVYVGMGGSRAFGPGPVPFFSTRPYNAKDAQEPPD